MATKNVITKIYEASPEEVFDYLDDLGITGMHMKESSIPMMGGKMVLEFLTEEKKGLNTKYRWTGKVLWWELDFTVIVTNWIRGQAKTWETIGLTKLIIYSWFRMNLKIRKVPVGTEAQLSISYEKPKGFFNTILCYLLGRWYCNWCIKNMFHDTEEKIAHANRNFSAHAV